MAVVVVNIVRIVVVKAISDDDCCAHYHPYRPRPCRHLHN